jgi:hypothetical protein
VKQRQSVTLEQHPNFNTQGKGKCANDFIRSINYDISKDALLARILEVYAKGKKAALSAWMRKQL